MKQFAKFIFLGLLAIGTLQAKPAAQEPKKEPELVVLSWEPRIFYYKNFLSDEECDYIIEKAKPELQRSTVVDSNSTEGKIDPVRTSQGMFFTSNITNPTIQKIEKRISDITHMPVENGESIQVLSYGHGAEYKPHHDYFENVSLGGSSNLNRGGQRVLSFIMYLNTPKSGGETIFPKVDIKVKPKKGDAVLFYDCLPDGNEDPMTLHGGAPVLEGEKWIATKWMRKGLFK